MLPNFLPSNPRPILSLIKLTKVPGPLFTQRVLESQSAKYGMALTPSSGFEECADFPNALTVKVLSLIQDQN